MDLPELCIRRPVFATVLSLVLVLVGLVGWQRLTVREYPNIDQPVVSVATTWPGAAPEIVETQVTQVLEGSISGISGIDYLSSTSRSEASRITVVFRLGTDPDDAASDVRDRVSRVRGRLPQEIEEPVIAKTEADADPVLHLTFFSDTLTTLQITDQVDRFVVDRLQTVPGVSEVRIFGERRYAMRIWVDRARLAAYDLTVQDLEDALRRQNLDVPGGRIESIDREFSVFARSDLATPEQFAAVVLRDFNGFQVTMGDVARVEIGAEDERRVTRFNGRNAVSVGVVRQSTANPLDVAREVRAALPELRKDLPAGIEVVVANDQTVFIDRSIRAIFTTIAEAVALVVLVVLLFLRSWRATLIPVVTIPVSLVASFALMALFGFTINTLTLLALVLAIGLVVDDAIVVLENVHRQAERGLPPRAAAIRGTREIAFAVVAMTLTLAAVFAPIAMTPGRTGQLFVEFALTLAGAVLVSGFVALTLTPMMCARMAGGGPGGREGRLARGLRRALEALEAGYRRLLRTVLAVAWTMVPLGLAIAVAVVCLFQSLPRELAPTEDRGYIRTTVRAPDGATIDYTARTMQRMEPLLADLPELESLFLISGVPEVSRGIAMVRLKPWEARARAQQSLTPLLRQRFARVPGIVAVPVNPPALGQDPRSPPVQIVVQTIGSYDELARQTAAFIRALEDDGALIDVVGELSLTAPKLDVLFDRKRIADVGVSVDAVGRTLETFLAGRQVTRFTQNGEQYDVMIQLADDDRRTPDDLAAIYLRGRDGAMIQLGNLVTVTETVGPRELTRFNQFRSATITAAPAPGLSLGEVLDRVEQVAETALPAGARLDYAGPSRDFKKAGSDILFIFVLALLFIFLLLAAQFESFAAPLVILLTVPLSAAGALFALHLAGCTLNVYSQIGLVTLVGLITKHAILIVEFMIQLEQRGLGRLEAVVRAASLRLRPILMTTGAMVLGALPLALAEGAGAESRHQIGWVIVGGLSFGTILTLFVIPAACLLLPRSGRVEAPVDDEAAAAA